MPQFARKALERSLKEWMRLVAKYNDGLDDDKTSALAEMAARLKIAARGGVNLVLDVSEEDHCIQSSCEIEKNPNSALMEYNKFFNVREDEFRKRLEKYKPDILQVSGHGSDESLCFCDGIFGERHASRGIDDIVQDVARLEAQPKVIVITCCHSKRLANALLEKTNVKAIIASEGSLTSRNAIEFTRIFYAAIATGKSVEEAYSIATCGKGMRGRQGLQIYEKRNAKEQIRFFSEKGWNDMNPARVERLSKSNHKFDASTGPLTPIHMDRVCNNHAKTGSLRERQARRQQEPLRNDRHRIDG